MKWTGVALRQGNMPFRKRNREETHVKKEDTTYGNRICCRCKPGLITCVVR